MSYLDLLMNNGGITKDIYPRDVLCRNLNVLGTATGTFNPPSNLTGTSLSISTTGGKTFQVSDTTEVLSNTPIVQGPSLTSPLSLALSGTVTNSTGGGGTPVLGSYRLVGIQCTSNAATVTHSGGVVGVVHSATGIYNVTLTPFVGTICFPTGSTVNTPGSAVIGISGPNTFNVMTYDSTGVAADIAWTAIVLQN